MRATATMMPMGAPPGLGSRRTARRIGDAWRAVADDPAVVAVVGGGREVVVPLLGCALAPLAAEDPPVPVPVPATNGLGPGAVADDGDVAGPPGPPDGLVPDAADVGGDVDGTVPDGVVVVVVGGTDAGHRVEASEADRGGGSAGVALPSGSNRHPSTSPANTFHDAGPSLA
jgi:hypothetical protein